MLSQRAFASSHNWTTQPVDIDGIDVSVVFVGVVVLNKEKGASGDA